MLKKTTLIIAICSTLTFLIQCKTKKISQLTLESHHDTITSINLSEINIGSFPKKYLSYRNISHLNLSGLKLSDTALYTIINAYPKLESITLDNCNLQNLPTNINSLKNLKHLSLVNNQNLKNLPNNETIRYLNAKDCNSILNFEIINSYNNITYLNLSGSNINNQQLLSFHLNNLNYLNLSSTNIENIYFVNSLPKLMELDIRNTQISEVSKIRKTFPRIKIVYTDNDTIKKQLQETKLVKPYF